MRAHATTPQASDVESLCGSLSSLRIFIRNERACIDMNRRTGHITSQSANISELPAFYSAL